MTEICSLCLGTAPYGTGTSEDDAFMLMDHYYELGGRILDTAHVYGVWQENGAGASEKCIGKWLQSRNCRSDIAIMTKGAHPDFKSGEKRVTQDAIRSDISDSLERMHIETIDMYWLHRDDPNIPISEIAQWMHDFHVAGLFKTYGVSNWSYERIDELLSYAHSNNLLQATGNQLGFSLAKTKEGTGSHNDTIYMTKQGFQWHTQAQFSAYAFSSQASGLFSKCSNFQALMDHEKLNAYKIEANKSVIEHIQELSHNYLCSPNQLALHALLKCPFPCYPIIGARTAEQMSDSMNAQKLQIKQEDLESLMTHWQQ